MGTLVGFVLGGWLAWNFGIGLAVRLVGLNGSEFAFFGVIAGVFLAGFVVGNGAMTALQGQFRLNGGGLWSSAFGRRLIGFAADGVLGLACSYGAYLILGMLPTDRLIAWFHPDPETNNSFWIYIGLLYLMAGVLSQLQPVMKVAIGKGTRPFRRTWRSILHGVGGSSHFEGLLEEWANPWKPGQIYLGTSLYDPKWKVGRTDDRHFLTIATSRSGKGTSGIIPNLLTWPGSALVIDPKGENAAITAMRRATMGQTVRVVDPFGVLKDIGVVDSRDHWRRGAYPIFRFNPLAEVELESLNVVEQIREITESMIVASSKTNPFFDDAAKKIITGVIAHVLSHHSIADEDKHLGTMRDFLIEANGRDITQLANNKALGGLAAAAAQALRTGSGSASGDVLLTAQVHTEWLDSLAMRHCLSASEFSLKDIKREKVSLYLVLPADMIEKHARFLRMFVTLALRAVSKGRRADHAVLFLLDEFHSLGTIPILASSAGLVAGFGVKMWPIVQNLSQIQERYPEAWETFIGNAGMRQVFAVNDLTTARYVSESLGNHIAWQKVWDNARGVRDWVPMGATWLRTSVEIARDTSRDSGNQLVQSEGGRAFLLRRTPYFEIHKPSDYCTNPYEPESPLWKQAWLAMKTDDQVSPYVMQMADRAVKRMTGRDVADWLESRSRSEGQGAHAGIAPQPEQRVESKPLIAVKPPTQGDAPKPSRDIDWSRMSQSRPKGNGQQMPQPARPGAPQQPVAPRHGQNAGQGNGQGNGIDWTAVGAAWGLEQTPQRPERPPTQEADDGLREPPPLKTVRRRTKGKGQSR